MFNVGEGRYHTMVFTIGPGEVSSPDKMTVVFPTVYSKFHSTSCRETKVKGGWPPPNYPRCSLCKL